MPEIKHVRSFRRIQMDIKGNRKVLLVDEFSIDGEPTFTYVEEGRPDYVLHSKNGRLNYLQFLRA